MHLKGRRAAVTGGGQGIGAAIVEAFAHEGAEVAILDMNRATAAALAHRLEAEGHGAHAIEVDVADPVRAREAVEEAARVMGGLDILVNNAGVRVVAPFLEHTPAEIRRQFEVNVFGAFYCSQAAARIMIEAGYGRIVNLASIASFVGRPDRAAYCAAKAAVLGLTRAAAGDLRGTGVTVNCLAPGMIATPFNAHHSEHPEIGPRWAGENAAGRWGRADDIANAAVFLASEAASYISGTDLKVDSAWTAFKARSGELEGEV